MDLARSIFLDPRVMKFSLHGVQNVDQVQQRLQEFQRHQGRYGFTFWAVVLKETGELLGYAGFVVIELDGQREIGFDYRLARKYWGQGFENELFEACKDYIFETLGVMRIICAIDPHNTQFLNLVEQFNFVYEKDSLYADKIPARVYVLNRF